jgi:hypothetical protein
MGETIELRIDRVTAEDLRDALHALGEHIAAGVPIDAMPSDTAERLGRFLRDLDIHLGGTGRFA